MIGTRARTAGLTAALGLTVGLGVSGCAGDGASEPPTGSAGTAGTTGTTAPSEPASALPQSNEPVQLDPADFSTVIDNPYWPMEPGTTWVYEETDPEAGTQRVEVTVTNETKTVAAGIEARVVHDVVSEDGEVIEDTFDWYAQDTAGNIWYLGEDTKEFRAARW